MAQPSTTEERAALASRALWRTAGGGIFRIQDEMFVWETVPSGMAAKPGDSVPKKISDAGYPHNNAAILWMDD